MEAYVEPHLTWRFLGAEDAVEVEEAGVDAVGDQEARHHSDASGAAPSPGRPSR